MDIEILYKTILDLQNSNSDKIYKNNMITLKKYDMKLYNSLNNLTDDDEYITVQKDKKTIFNLVSFNKGIVYYDIDNPLRSVENEFKSMRLKNTRIAIILGLGLGYELMYYLTMLATEQNTESILVIEKDVKIFKKALQTTDMRAFIINKGIKFIVGNEIEDMFVIFRDYLNINNRYQYIKCVNAITYSPVFNQNKRYYVEALTKFREAGVFHVNYFGNSPDDSLLGIKNMLNNLDEIINNPGINLLFNKFKNKPAIIISTGPSLNKNKNLLKGLEEKALLIAPEASLNVLLEMGVKPHIIVSLERTDGILPFLQGFSQEDVEETYFAACPVIDKKVYDAYKGPRLITYRNFEQFKWIGIERGILDIKLSSGNMAFKIAEALGCSTIILIGQDLAYGEDGATHAKGFALDKDEARKRGTEETLRQRGILEVKGNIRETVVTSKVWYNFLKGYELDLANYNGTCINSTEGGAYIEGTKVMPFKDAIEKYINENYYPLEIIKNNLKEFNNEQRTEDSDKVLSIVINTIDEMEYIVKCCEDGLEICEKYKKELENYLKEKSVVDVKRMEFLKKEILKNRIIVLRDVKVYQSFFMHIIQSFEIKFNINLNALPQKHEIEELIDVEALLNHNEWYKVNVDIGSVALNELKKAKELIQSINISE
ncbi:motility associated factor glycosyltransferase family protein [Clostridium beijerinckii]|uniref:motility associated factor glycosyltransferase family protein n=1 Tax=Clostridium beijerinckii TaxID=1520 RepID=UPI00080A6118|nr:6-hydroxymethylpterin diphosphokinase MptE-like protein [Clostridium beijerinckii]OCA96803.1 hypothetical protein BGS1_05990 [Clostridium beijerinckii]